MIGDCNKKSGRYLPYVLFQRIREPCHLRHLQISMNQMTTITSHYWHHTRPRPRCTRRLGLLVWLYRSLILRIRLAQKHGVPMDPQQPFRVYPRGIQGGRMCNRPWYIHSEVEERNGQAIYIWLRLFVRKQQAPTKKKEYLRIMIEERTTNDTMGWSTVERWSCCVTGGLFGVGRRCRANVEMKTAPTPICP